MVLLAGCWQEEKRVKERHEHKLAVPTPVEQQPADVTTAGATDGQEQEAPMTHAQAMALAAQLTRVGGDS